MTKTKVELSSLDKVYFPKAGITKGDLVNYYQNQADYILPYIKDRPHSLLRQPDGIKGEAFFQKDMDHMSPDWVKVKSIYSKSNQEQTRYLIGDSLDSLLYMVQLGCIEINPWNSRVESLNKPDWCVLDLDPDGVEFAKVAQVAKQVKKACDELRLPCYPKTSGKTGIHIYMPLHAQYAYLQVRQFTKLLAQLIYERTQPLTSLERQPAKRRHKVYLDYLQNSKGQTLAAPYSVRPTHTATVSAPLHWDEIDDRLDPLSFTINTMPTRLSRVGDIWQPVLGQGIDIKKAKTEISQLISLADLKS